MSAISKDCKENSMIGMAFVSGSDLLCPVPTSAAVAVSEKPDLRAYKLGKKKCSYNQVELLFYDVSGQKPVEMKISEAIETCTGAEVEDVLKESCIKFNVRFLNNMMMHLYLYVVYANAHLKLSNPSPSPGPGPDPEMKYYWMPVTRSKCKKGCVGPVIRGLQRFGRMSRRGEGAEQDSWKDPRHLYIAIDEASTHVCIGPEIPKFRLLLAAYNDQYELLGTTVSSSLRVLANNDAPLGAASLKVHLNLQVGWGHALPQIPRLSNRSDRMPLGDIEVHPQLMDGNQPGNDSAIVSHGSSTKKTQGSSAKQAEPAQNLNQDNHSLNELCERLFEICASKVDHVISLRTLAALLGARRKRICEIFNVLQCVRIVEQKKEEEKYTWLGATKISSAIKKIKREARHSHKPDGGRMLKRLREEMVENPIRELTEIFIQLFLVDEKRPITLEFAMEALIDTRSDPQTHRSKIRRLTEIARIFTVSNLIGMENPDSDRGFSSDSLFSWRGARGVAERLEIADSGKRILKRRYAGLNANQKPVKKSEIAMQSMPGLVTESEDDDEEFLPSLETECNRLIKRPRLCATGSSYSGSVAAKDSSPVKELDHNNTDAVNMEAAAILICLSSSDQPNTIKERYSPEANVSRQIAALTEQKPSALSEVDEKSNCQSNALAELCSKRFEVDLAFPGPEQEFKPLCHLQQVLSPWQIVELEAKNPGFMTDLILYSRQLYQRWCTEKFANSKHENLFNPVPLRAVDNANYAALLAGDQNQM